MSNHLRLPAERIEQLRQIAAAKSKSIPEIIGDYIRSEIDAGTIPAHVPGIEISKSQEEITIKANSFEVTIPLHDGSKLADLLLESGEITATDPARKKRWLAGLGALSGVQVKRAGNGVKLVSPITGTEHALSLDVAADVAAQIARTAE